ncbi:GntR family transcriptional regulator [Paenibacillus arenosi]|uniref:GntR family transcriptional regulator n=1 Tax=Paenibacillus arenosi TaxID=2774142 RepID=A0ABR9B0N4_9BACL|nr:GntR family transcriptional regulator [Paenibacillus arenosi]MBD8499893.1 GntR family transcriptional regulator [Paenibacillus arenosi]
MFIPIQLDENSTEPLYAQIKSQLKTLILSGHIETGTLLPSIRELAGQLSCSVITIRRVYQDLEQEGLLRTKQGTGTFVAPVHQGERDQFRKRAVEEAIMAAIDAAKQMQIDEQELRDIFNEIVRIRMRND